ncbi:MAG: hypothetical protein FJ098_11245 [Deltaproteobacteria bacterium]|nr:hypothetical protein [Deltaproteobacteria bacterium]
MGKKNAFTFARRQRELDRKKKQEEKRAARLQRKAEGTDEELPEEGPGGTGPEDGLAETQEASD